MKTYNCNDLSELLRSNRNIIKSKENRIPVTKDYIKRG